MELKDHQIIGWDMGGANIKAVRMDREGRKTKDLKTAVRPFEIWRDPHMLPTMLRDMGEELGLQPSQRMAVTMTAELSDAFRTKREGVLHVLEAAAQVFETSPIYFFSLDGGFLSPDDVRQDPLLCAATNWLASALFIARRHPDCILMDIGSTTTDIIPIKGGDVISKGLTDTQRLISGELVYTGVLRTNPNTVAGEAPVGGRHCRVAAEYFSSMADVYLILGQISPDQYTCPTADGKAKTITAAQDRLARLVCSDSELMAEREIHGLARYLWEKQVQQIVAALFQVLSGLHNDSGLPLAVAGTGGFLAREAARRAGMAIIELGRDLGDCSQAPLPALAVAYLLAEEVDREKPV